MGKEDKIAIGVVILLAAIIGVMVWLGTGSDDKDLCPRGQTREVTGFVPVVQTINKTVTVTDEPIYGCVKA